MKKVRKSDALFCGTALVVLLFVFWKPIYMTWRLMSDAPTKTCDSKFVQSLPIGSGAYIISDQLICDDGLNVTGAYRVFIRILEEQGQSKDIKILEQSSVGSASRRPDIRIISNSEVVVTSVKALVIHRGPKKVGAILVRYEDF